MIEFEVVKTLYLKPLKSTDKREEDIKLRLEVLQSTQTGLYHARMFRLETYSVQASFGSEEFWHKEIFIADKDHAEWENICCETIDEVLKTVKGLIWRS